MRLGMGLARSGATGTDRQVLDPRPGAAIEGVRQNGPTGKRAATRGRSPAQDGW